MSWRPIGLRIFSPLARGLELLVEFVLFPISLAFVLLCAAFVRVLGVDVSYKLFFIVLAFAILLKTIRGW